jgi:transcription elongation GreA/GreB family factor
MNKAALRDAVIARLETELELQTAAANSSREEATDAESRAEGKYDMRGQSAAYLAAGQAKLTAEIADAIAAYRTLPLTPFPMGGAIGIGAVVTIEAGKQRTAYLLGPARGGLEVEVGGVPVTVVTPGSALGQRLLGRRVGDRIVARPGVPPVDAAIIAAE